MENQVSIENVAIKLFAFMRQAGIKCTFQKDESALFAYLFDARDMTEDGTPISVGFRLDPSTINDIENTPAAIEAFCLHSALKVSHALLEEKFTRLLQHVEKSKLYVPGQK